MYKIFNYNYLFAYHKYNYIASEFQKSAACRAKAGKNDTQVWEVVLVNVLVIQVYNTAIVEVLVCKSIFFTVYSSDFT